MRNFAFKPSDIESLSKRADKLASLIAREFPPQTEGGNIRKISCEDIEAFLERHNVIVCWDDFCGGEAGEGIEYAIEAGADKQRTYLICINSVIRDKMQNPDNVVVCVRALKEILLHEISHLILQHPGVLLPADSDRATMEILSNMFWSYAQFTKEGAQWDHDAELMSLILGFWPTDEFTRLFKHSKADMRAIANGYKMSVESAIQWALISFSTVLKMHYLKWKCKSEDLEYNYGVEDIGVDIFRIPGTAAHQAFTHKIDANTIVPFRQEYECRAYFEAKDYFWNYQEDIVLVVGFKKQYFDAFVSV